MTELEGTTVVVTGAASGIGHALARGFLQDGASVIGCDVQPGALDQLRREGATCVTADVTDSASMASVVDAAVEATGRVDVLINNAGLGFERRIEDNAGGEFERVLEVNLVGPYLGIRAALPVMRAQGHGRIINMISRGAEATRLGMGAYAASKAGLFALTRVLARELEGSGILVNGLIPGPIATPMNPRGTEPAESVYPAARALATLPPDGPSGRAFWGEEEYLLFQSSDYQRARDVAYREYRRRADNAVV